MRKFLFALAFCLVPVVVFASANVTFQWDANTESDLAGYRLYQGVSSGVYDAVVADIPAGTETVTIAVDDGTYFWALTAYDADGNESGFSNEVMRRVDTTPPAPPTGFWALVQKIIAWLLDVLGVA